MHSLPSRCCRAVLLEFDGGDEGFEHGFELVGEFRRVGGVDHQVDTVNVDGPEHDVFGGVTPIGDDVAEGHVDVAVLSRVARTQPEVAVRVLVEDVGFDAGRWVAADRGVGSRQRS